MLMQISNGILRKALIATAALLCCAYLIQLILMLNELRNWAEPKSGFALDAPHLHTVEFYHALSLILLLAIVLAKKYYWAFGVAIGYFILDIFATYDHLSTGFLEGDMCPEGHPCLRAIRRASGLDLSAASLLLIIVCVITLIIVLQLKARSRLS